MCKNSSKSNLKPFSLISTKIGEQRARIAFCLGEMQMKRMSRNVERKYAFECGQSRVHFARHRWLLATATAELLPAAAIQPSKVYTITIYSGGQFSLSICVKIGRKGRWN